MSLTYHHVTMCHIYASYEYDMSLCHLNIVMSLTCHFMSPVRAVCHFHITVSLNISCHLHVTVISLCVTYMSLCVIDMSLCRQVQSDVPDPVGSR